MKKVINRLKDLCPPELCETRRRRHGSDGLGEREERMGVCERKKEESQKEKKTCRKKERTGKWEEQKVTELTFFSAVF